MSYNGKTYDTWKDVASVGCDPLQHEKTPKQNKLIKSFEYYIGLNPYRNITSYYYTDAITLTFAALKNGVVTKLTTHCTQVPGWILAIKEKLNKNKSLKLTTEYFKHTLNPSRKILIACGLDVES